VSIGVSDAVIRTIVMKDTLQCYDGPEVSASITCRGLIWSNEQLCSDYLISIQPARIHFNIVITALIGDAIILKESDMVAT
jgi:hypothetical protein